MPLRFAEPEKPTTSGDPRIPQGDPMIDVAIFGAAGSGKSSFIRKMTRQEDISIEGQFRSGR